MAAVIIAGFEGDSVIAECSKTIGAPTLVAGRNGGQALRLAAATNYVNFTGRAAGGAAVTMFRSYRFYMRINAVPSTPTSLVGQGPIALELNANGTLRLNLDTSSATVFPVDSAFHLVEVNGATGTIGETMSLWVDGVLHTSSVGYATIALASSLSIGIIDAAAGGSIDIDDFVAYSGPITAGGDYNTSLLRPVGDTAIGNWKRNDAASVYPMSPVLGQTPPKGVAITTTLGETYVQNAVAGSNVAADTIEVELEPPGGVSMPPYGPGAATVTRGLTSTTTVLASSFTVPVGVAGLRSLNVLMGKNGTPTDDAIWQIRTHDAVNDTPTTTTLASYSLSPVPLLSNTGLTTLRERVVLLNCALTPGTKYWLCLTRAGAASANAPDTARANGLAGELVKEFASGTWTQVGVTGESLFYDNVVWTPTQDQAATVDILDMVPFVNTAQQVTTGSPKSGALAVHAVDDSTPSLGLTNGANVGFANSNHQRLAQAFTTQRTGPTSVQLACAASAGSVAITDAVMEFRNDVGGSPGSTVLFTSASFTVTTTQTRITLATTSGALAANTKYWAVFLRSGGAVDPANTNTPFIDVALSGLGEFKGLNGSTWTLLTGSSAALRLNYAAQVPVDATFDYGLPNGAAGSITAAAQAAFPAGWGTTWGAASGPLGTGYTLTPRLRFRRTGTYARVVSADFAAAYVQWKPGTQTSTGTGTTSGAGTVSGTGVATQPIGGLGTVSGTGSIAGTGTAQQSTIVTTAVPPDTVLLQTGITGVVASVRDDPLSPDATFMTGAPGTAVDVRFGFEPAQGTLVNGAAQQKFRFRLRRSV